MKKISNLFLAVMAITFVSFPVVADEYNIIDRKQDPQLYCLALNIYFESRGEPIQGQFAVADVTLNRVESTVYPNTICDVVYHCRRPDRCQFSWVHEIRNPRDPVIAERQAWHDAQLYAYEVARWGINRGITEGSTYFHADYVKPFWSDIFYHTMTVGSHLFYRDPSRG